VTGRVNGEPLLFLTGPVEKNPDPISNLLLIAVVANVLYCVFGNAEPYWITEFNTAKTGLGAEPV
jgi:hypothetical protein